MPRHVRSRHNLTRCTACRAHVRAAETPSVTKCPFCQAPITRTRRTAPRGRSALVAAGLAALTASACGGGDDAADDDTTTEPIDDTAGDDNAGNDNANDDGVAGDDTFDDGQDNAPVAEYGVAPEPAPEPMYGIAPDEG